MCYISTSLYVGQFDTRLFKFTDTTLQLQNYEVMDMHTNNNRIAMACSDRMVRIYDEYNLKLICEFEGNNEFIRRVKFSPDGI